MQIQLNEEILIYLESKFGIIGESQIMQEQIQKLLLAAPTDLSVLITGDTGTGKEVFANALHGLSKRKNFPFVSVNCGAIPETLLEAELFGHERGAYTGADSLRKGYFETADKGTIFLDEIGEMPYSTQVKLLRILESGEFSRLGSSENKRVDVRIIAATNRELEFEVDKGNFRQDLFFRLKNVHITLPVLNQHLDDIPKLISFFSKKLAKKLNIPVEEYDRDIIEILQAQNWKGNIREFKNLLETIITLEKSTFITPNVLRKYLTPALPPHNPHIITNAPIVSNKSHKLPDSELGLIFRSLLELQNGINDLKHISSIIQSDVFDLKIITNKPKIQALESQNTPHYDFENMTISEMEQIMIENALKKSKGNRRVAAKKLGISERTLYRKLVDFGLNN